MKSIVAKHKRILLLTFQYCTFDYLLYRRYLAHNQSTRNMTLSPFQTNTT